MSVQFQIKTARNGKFYFNLLAPNGQVILTSQMYATAKGARKGLDSVRTNAADADRYQRRRGKSGKSHFVLRAANHRVIGCSEIYNSAAALEQGIRSVMRNGPAALATLVQ